MSIETEVSSMIENIKKDYKAIEDLGATIPEDKNIENIANCLEEVYDNLPKTTGEDTNLSLNTLKGKMNTTLKGDTSQYTTNGYNVLELVATTIKSINTSATWNNNEYILDGIKFKINVNSSGVVESINVSGTSTQQVTFYLFNSNNYLASGNYLLSGATGGSSTTYDLRIYNANGTGEVKQNFTTPVSVTSNGGTQGINCAIVVRSGQTLSNVVIYPMLESGSTAHNWEPYTRKYCFT